MNEWIMKTDQNQESQCQTLLKQLRLSSRCRWVNEWMNKWINKWMNDWMYDWMNDWMYERLKEWIIEWMNEWLNKWMIEWINERINEWINEWLIDWMSKTDPIRESQCQTSTSQLRHLPKMQVNEWMNELMNHKDRSNLGISMSSINIVTQTLTQDAGE